MLVLNYPTKKVLAEAVGEPLNYTETSIFGEEYAPNKVIYGSNRPHITGFKREFYAEVTISKGLISRVK
jgi:hypothetical protein|tara:strand:+ start:87 stop:293 length:207 start_codon:yes stop_codon:yes gene_type:complete